MATRKRKFYAAEHKTVKIYNHMCCLYMKNVLISSFFSIANILMFAITNDTIDMAYDV